MKVQDFPSPWIVEPLDMRERQATETFLAVVSAPLHATVADYDHIEHVPSTVSKVFIISSNFQLFLLFETSPPRHLASLLDLSSDMFLFMEPLFK